MFRKCLVLLLSAVVLLSPFQGLSSFRLYPELLGL